MQKKLDTGNPFQAMILQTKDLIIEKVKLSGIFSFNSIYSEITSLTLMSFSSAGISSFS